MKDTPTLRLAVTGAPRTGKTAVCTALSLVTGMDYATISDHLAAPTGERRLAYTVEAPVRAFEHRMDTEARLSAFISDGSVLHEWAAAEALRRTRRMSHWIRNPRDLPYRTFEKRFLGALGEIVHRRARTTYHGFVHLRLDPASVDDDVDTFRTTTDQVIREAIHATSVPYVVTAGTVEEIVTGVAGMFQLPLLMPVDDAVNAALHAA
ncbi:hypothetical protein [Nocardia bovistercoris]|uniref:Uncharacterized protein n=1 Tax=Nocardia bovistercoris TaxID=2785916 RepID=A0A931I796_9NOCA|nr:hypothetical protein [Nocardia bovistercoris]MBH0776174.1 hypothetical protein [Nocardia bovistercoris]